MKRGVMKHVPAKCAAQLCGWREGFEEPHLAKDLFIKNFTYILRYLPYFLVNLLSPITRYFNMLFKLMKHNERKM